MIEKGLREAKNRITGLATASVRAHGEECEQGDLEPCPLEEASKLELLTAVDILRDLSEQQMEALENSIPMFTAKKGDVLYGPTRNQEAFFLLKSGSVELCRQSPDGKKLTLAIIKHGSFFGEMLLLPQRLLGTSAIALEDSMICTLGLRDVQVLLLEHPRVALRVIEALAQRLHQAEDALQGMAFDDVMGRLSLSMPSRSSALKSRPATAAASTRISDVIACRS